MGGVKLCYRNEYENNLVDLWSAGIIGTIDTNYNGAVRLSIASDGCIGKLGEHSRSYGPGGRGGKLPSIS